MKKILLTSTLCATIAFGGADVLPVEKRTFVQSKFIPDISLVMDASYVSRNMADDKVAHLEVPGIAHGLLGSHSHGGSTHTPNNAKNGFNLNYAELVLSSSVDPFFTMDGIFHFSEDAVEIEELYFTSTALGHGARIKGGKFNSNFGYLNEQHHHSWDFADMPLVYEAFLGMHGINESGLQLQWIAPTDTYLMIGAEILQGENTQMFGKDKIGTYTTQADAPALFVGYIKTSFDIDDTTVLAGLSYAQGSSRIDHSDDESPHVFSGESKLYGADFLVKHYFDSYSFLKWQSEVLHRDMDGVQYNLNPADTTAVLTSPTITKKQSGLYTQLVYGINKSWHTGVRYDTIFQNDITSNGVKTDTKNSFNKYSAMVEYHTSEFARFRLQYNHNSSLYNEDGNRQDINTLILQANISIGAHGAHGF
ncbi:TonB-dependent receptor [Sulfurimonas sp.]|uniref:TonB-dependent receptor n=1 Tax=Sulfurimonas sp. TaxID=2022749 RepID=UPI00356231C0